ncbi:MAG TPA: hypothetical protein DDY20_11270 [Desulfobulbaceae bacterium]|nr:hypothetical protein [Desulfobulbaceae bacterium]
MPSKTCPKCGKKSDNPASCTQCGLDFAEYERTKLEMLGEVHRLLGESRFMEAKQVAEKLPAQFPDNRTDFVLLLSNINRDISIVEKCELAQKAYDEGDYTQAGVLLRNIKAFDSTLNERVVSLRRKAERPLHDSEQFQRAKEAFDQGNYPAAKALFKQIRSSSHQEEIAGYLQTIDARTREVLNEAIDCINSGRFAQAETRFAELQQTFPDLQNEIAGYLDLLSRRAEIRERIMAAANRARAEQRLVEAKILYSYLGLQFPEILPEVRPRLQEIGPQTVVSLADLQELGTLDLAALGVEIGASAPGRAAASTDLDGDIPRDRHPADIAAIAAVTGNRPAAADEFTPPLEINVEEIPDFIF